MKLSLPHNQRKQKRTKKENQLTSILILGLILEPPLPPRVRDAEISLQLLHVVGAVAGQAHVVHVVLAAERQAGRRPGERARRGGRGRGGRFYGPG